MGRPKTGSFKVRIEKTARKLLKTNIHVTAHDIQESHPEYSLITCRKGLAYMSGQGDLIKTNVKVRKNGQRVFAYKEPDKDLIETQKEDNRIISHCLPYY